MTRSPTSLATAPTRGRSSAGSVPMPRSTAVSSPFFPRYWICICSSAPGSAAADISARALSARLLRSRLRVSKSTFLVLVLSPALPTWSAPGIQNPRSSGDESRARGTTPVPFPASVIACRSISSLPLRAVGSRTSECARLSSSRRLDLDSRAPTWVRALRSPVSAPGPLSGADRPAYFRGARTPGFSERLGSEPARSSPGGLPVCGPPSLSGAVLASSPSSPNSLCGWTTEPGLRSC